MSDTAADMLYSTPAMAAAFAPRSHLRQMLAFEAALARAEARAGIIPPAAAQAIAAACQTLDVDLDVEAIYRDAAVAGTPAISLVRALTARVADGGRDYVHWGATSQDAIDTATVLQMRDGLTLLDADLLRLGAACAALAGGHRHTLMAGRTLLQQALPMPFGLKAARWLGAAMRQVRALRAQQAALALQFGGAVGTLAALGTQGLQVAALLAADLGLLLPDLPWHAERDRVASVAAVLGITAGTTAKIAQDITLLAQSEVSEVAEASAPGKGGSSAMPQKRNPVDATLALAAARLALGQAAVLLPGMVQEHERATGGWQAEWVAAPALFRYTAGAVAHVERCVAGLEVDTERMAANLAQDGGLSMAESLAMALAPHLGRPTAQAVVREVCARAAHDKLSLRQAALGDPRVRALLTPEGLGEALDPARYLGSAGALIDRALEDYHRVREGQD